MSIRYRPHLHTSPLRQGSSFLRKDRMLRATPWLIHNHPSGSPEPSRQDIAITRDIADAAGKLGIALHDHIIIGGSEFRSFRAMGLL